jgi:flavin-dependent thymidylate synthase
MSNIRKWADEAMFVAAPMNANRTKDGHVVPKVTLLWMTPDPLGANAAMGRMYKGIPTYHLADISNEEREQFFKDSMATHLRAPLESIKFHFFIEGVTRSFTHQMVRQRTAVYAQESLRFAVKENMANEVSIPPSLAGLPADSPTRVIWDEAIDAMDTAYNRLVAAGVPAEDARGITPHAVTTRLHYVTDLRNLAEHAGNRLCTQAQFEWRVVFMEIVRAIRMYTPDMGWADSASRDRWEHAYRWQFNMLASSELFRPVCYQLGRCPFNASFDRGCKIKLRVEEFESQGIRSEHWGDQTYLDQCGGKAIDPAEWLFDHTAARMAPGTGGH